MPRIKPHDAPILNLLVVDDDADTRMALRNYLQATFEGAATVEVASYGADAMRKMEATPVDVLLTDENMPGMRGTQLVAWAQERHPGVRCLIMSAESGSEFEEATGALGVRVFRKPFSPATIAELVAAVAGPGRA